MTRSSDESHTQTETHENLISVITNAFLDQKRVNICEHTVMTWCHHYCTFTYICSLLIKKERHLWLPKYIIQVSLCLCLTFHLEISSFLSRSFPFPFLFIMLSILRNYPFYMVSNADNMYLKHYLSFRRGCGEVKVGWWQVKCSSCDK